MRVSEKAIIENMPFGFKRGKVNRCNFHSRQLQEKYIAKKKGLGWHSLILRKR